MYRATPFISAAGANIISPGRPSAPSWRPAAPRPSGFRRPVPGRRRSPVRCVFPRKEQGRGAGPASWKDCAGEMCTFRPVRSTRCPRLAVHGASGGRFRRPRRLPVLPVPVFGFGPLRVLLVLVGRPLVSQPPPWRFRRGNCIAPILRRHENTQVPNVEFGQRGHFPKRSASPWTKTSFRQYIGTTNLVQVPFVETAFDPGRRLFEKKRGGAPSGAPRWRSTQQLRPVFPRWIPTSRRPSARPARTAPIPASPHVRGLVTPPDSDYIHTNLLALFR
jgi:hypothetical protein